MPIPPRPRTRSIRYRLLMTARSPKGSTPVPDPAWRPVPVSASKSLSPQARGRLGLVRNRRQGDARVMARCGAGRGEGGGA